MKNKDMWQLHFLSQNSEALDVKSRMPPTK